MESSTFSIGPHTFIITEGLIKYRDITISVDYAHQLIDVINKRENNNLHLVEMKEDGFEIARRKFLWAELKEFETKLSELQS